MGAPPAGSRHGPGRLFVVATPIGNLADVTLRALEVLSNAPLVAAEDTRLTRRLFARHDLGTKLVSFHARSAPVRFDELIAHLRAGNDLALVTDAGTPGISDPGESLVAGWAAEGGQVVPIPGASAVTAAVAASGLAGPRWSFDGFLPRSGSERRRRLARIAGDERSTILFEAPTRIGATLRDLAAACGPDRPAAVCRELTKIHEQIVRATLGELIEAVRTGAVPARGEFVIVVGAIPPDVAAGDSATARAEAAGEPSPGDALRRARAEVERLVEDGVARGEAARRVAAASGLPRRQLYRTDR